MERLTERFGNGQYGALGCGNNCEHNYKYCRTDNCPTVDAIFDKLGQYEDIGTVEQFKISMDRQKSRKPYIQSDGHGDTEIDCYECPNCDSFIGIVSDCKDENYRDDYCPHCGQALDWSDLEQFGREDED